MPAPNPAVSHVRHVLIKLTVNANGVPTAEIDNLFTKCAGGGERIDVGI